MPTGDGHLNQKRRYTARAVLWFASRTNGEVIQPWQGKAREHDAALGLKSLMRTAAKRHRRYWGENLLGEAVASEPSQELAADSHAFPRTRLPMDEA